MAFTLPTVFTLGSKSRVSHASVHPRQYELNHYNDPRDHRDNRDNMTTAGSDFSLEIVTRAASQVLEVTEIEREIETTSTTVSLSVFSQ